MINRTLKTFAQHHAYIMRHGIVCFCRFVFIHILTFSLTHSTAGDIPRFPPGLPFTHRPQQNRLFACFSFSFFFFFSKSIHTQILTCFFKPTLRNMTVCYFLSTFFFLLFLCFFFLCFSFFFIKDRLCT